MSVSGTSLNDCHAGRGRALHRNQWWDPDPGPTFHMGAEPDPDLRLSKVIWKLRHITETLHVSTLSIDTSISSGVRNPEFRFGADPDPASQNDGESMRILIRNTEGPSRSVSAIYKNVGSLYTPTEKQCFGSRFIASGSESRLFAGSGSLTGFHNWKWKHLNWKTKLKKSSKNFQPSERTCSYSYCESSWFFFGRGIYLDPQIQVKHCRKTIDLSKIF